MESMLVHKGSEEKRKQLKRGNADLATVADKLNEKLKQHQQDSLKKCIAINRSPVDRIGMVTKDQSVKPAADKDHIIESLREKCQEFSRIFTSRQNVHVQIADDLHIYSDISQLEAVLQQAAKEQLLLEKRLAANELTDAAAAEAQLNSVKSLKMSNSRLEDKLSQLADELQGKEKLEVEVKQGRIEVTTLKEDMDVVQQRCRQLEKEIGEILLRNKELNDVNSDFRKQLDELGIYMKKLTEKNKQLEAEKHWCAEQLQLKQAECDRLIQAKEADTTNISHLKDRVATLEQQCLSRKSAKLIALMKQHCEPQLVNGDHSSILNDTDANHNMNNRASVAVPLHASDYQSANSANSCDHDESSSSVDIAQCRTSPGDGHSGVTVFVALYDYDPYQSSPNDQPDIELPLSAGEHVFITGDIDEDGFYNGTLTDGRCGLVPSNFVKLLYDDEGRKMDEIVTLQMSESLWQVNAADDDSELLCAMVTDNDTSYPQDISSDVSSPRGGDHLLTLANSESYHAGAAQFDTRSTSGQLSRSVCLTHQLPSQLNSTHVQSSVVQSGSVTMPSMTSRNSSAVSCDDTCSSNRENIATHRPLSEPCVVTDLCLNLDVQTLRTGNESVELMTQTYTDDYAQQLDQSHSMQSYDNTVHAIDADSNLHTASSSLQPNHIDVVPRPSAVFLKENCVSTVSDASSAMDSDEHQSNHLPPSAASELIVNTSIWRKVEPRRVSEKGNIESSEPAVSMAGVRLSSRDNVAGDGVCVEDREQSATARWSDLFNVHTVVVDLSDSSHVNRSHSDDADFCHLQLPSDHSDVCNETNVDAAEDSDLSETDYDLTDNNVVTAHQLRDNIPDSELIDYSDDGGESLIDSIACTNDDNEQVRVFVALFDYDPATMSPNPDAVQSELPFSEGQLIKVFGDPDADGFYYGECKGKRGLVPGNIVAMVEVDDAEAAMQLLRDSSVSAAADSSVTSSRASSQTSSYLQVNGDQSVHYMVAMYSYNPFELSPNIDADQELAFSRGDVIAVYGDADDDGFYFGELDGRSGLVPSNFLKEAPLGLTAS